MQTGRTRSLKTVISEDAYNEVSFFTKDTHTIINTQDWPCPVPGQFPHTLGIKPFLSRKVFIVLSIFSCAALSGSP